VVKGRWLLITNLTPLSKKVGATIFVTSAKVSRQL
jgi:hypothetical protein